MDDWYQEIGAVNGLQNLRPWTTLPGLRLVGISPTERVRCILDVVTMEVLGGAVQTQQLMKDDRFYQIMRSKMADIVVDLSQNPCRRSYTNRAGISKCMHTPSILYSFARDAVLLPMELMMIQGHRRDLQVPREIKPTVLHDLATMGICLPNLATLILALWMQGGFDQPEHMPS